MYRLTLGMVKATVAKVTNLCSTDTRVADYVNRCCERLLYMGKWPGTYGRFKVCVNNSCLVWPREVETVEAWAFCNTPGTIQNEWYEFLDLGLGLMQDQTCGSMQMIKQGETCTFDWVTGDDKKLAVYCDVTELASASIILRFYDENGNWVRTQNPGWIDGEKITLPAAGGYAYTTNTCAPTGPVSVIKPATNGVIRLYEYDTVNLTYKPLAYYQPDELIPVYSYSIVPGATSTGDCTTKTITITAKMRFIPVVNDNDFVQIPNVEAIRLGCQAIVKEEAGLIAEGTGFWQLAWKCLQDQLSHYQGAGATIPIRMTGSSAFASTGIAQIQ